MTDEQGPIHDRLMLQHHYVPGRQDDHRRLESLFRNHPGQSETETDATSYEFLYYCFPSQGGYLWASQRPLPNDLPFPSHERRHAHPMRHQNSARQPDDHTTQPDDTGPSPRVRMHTCRVASDSPEQIRPKPPIHELSAPANSVHHHNRNLASGPRTQPSDHMDNQIEFSDTVWTHDQA